MNHESGSSSDRVLDLRRGLPTWFSGASWFSRRAFRLVEWMLGYGRLNRLFTRANREKAPHESYFASLRRQFGMKRKIAGVLALPKTGPLIVVANHPFGGADAIALGEFVTEQRTDARVLANEFLASVDPLRPWLIGVDVYGGKDAQTRNLGGIREVARHLREGGCLVVFPAGEVASWQWRSWQIDEPSWSEHVASWAIRHRATIVPVFFHGQNSAWFQCLGALHPLLRTAWLGRELLRQIGSEISMRVGAPIGLAGDEEKDRLTEAIRRQTFALGKVNESAR